MLSVEKPPPPPDPQCSNNIQNCHHHHNHHHPSTSDNIDHHDHHHDHHRLLPFPLPVVLDLPNPRPLTPNFSIRDYVFTARSKDIKTNWPFSLKNLQLCLKHGVKDVLPPFQPLDAVRNQVCRRCTVDNAQSICNNSIDAEPAASEPADDAVLDSFNYVTQRRRPKEIKLPSTCVDTITSCRSGESNLFPSTTTSVCQSEIEQPVPAIKSTTTPLQTDTSLEAVSAEVEAEPAAPRAASHKTQTAARSSGKSKCKLIVKFGSHSDRSSTEDIASNCTTQSETMASKICPVCKTFSSSSNTTLNAHIDQCLSVEESTPKWTVDSKLTRHRIKPRKTRLMVDIYATALPCTLEDLDRRNGSNWASSSSFPIPDPESDKSDVPVEETTKHRVSHVPPDDRPSHIDVGDVYIDANGIKLRILSKSDDAPPVSKVIEHLRPRKPFKGGKGSKFLSARKKKRRASKFSKYLKLAQNKKLRSSKALSSQNSGGLGKNHVAEGSFEKEVCNMQKQINPCNSGTLRQWACSKRTGVVKKFNNKMRHQHMQCNWNVPEDLRPEIDQSRFHSSSLGQNLEEDEIMDLSGNPVSTHDRTDGLENVFYEAQPSRVVEQSPVGKGAGSSLSVGCFKANDERPLTPMKRNARQLRNERSSENDYHMLQPPKSTAISTSLPSPTDNSDTPPTICTKSSRSCHVSRSKAMKVASARNDMLSSKRSHVGESTSDVSNKCLGLKKSQLHLRTDEEMVLLDSEAIQPCDQNFAVNYQCGRDDVNEESSLCRNSGLTIRQNSGALGVSGRNEAVVSKSSRLKFQPNYPHDDSSSNPLDKFDDVGPGSKDFQCSMDDIISQPSLKISVRETVVSSHCKSGNPELNRLVPHTKIQSNSLRRKGLPCNVQVITGSSGQSLVSGGQEMFYADQLGNGMLVQNINIGEDIDSEVARGSSFTDSEVARGSSFPEVDPIPIPGPPGSFLPSPRDMGSEDFQGNSSLTTSRVQSSQDQLDFIDGDLSDSPASATSTISNSIAGRYEFKSSESLPYLGPHAGQDHVRSGFSGGSIDSSIENTALVTRSTSMAAERLTSFDKERFKVNKAPLSVKTDSEPCCCQRKERASQDHVILNSQESQLLKRRAMASASVPEVERQTSCDLNTGPNNVEVWADVFCSSSCPILNSEKVVLPAATKPPSSQHVLRGPMDAGVKFSGRSDCDSMSPSSSNSILRLMGKNLMVVNKDQDESMPPGQVQPQSQINHLTPQFSTFIGVSPTSAVKSQACHHSFPPNFHRGSVILGRDPQNVEGQLFDARISNGIRCHTSDPRTSQMLYRGAAYPFPNQHMDGGFANTIELCEFKADYNSAVPQKRLKHRLMGAPMGRMDHAITIPDHQHKNLLSAANNPIKEIITIDDASESEADLTCDIATYAGGFVGSHVVSSNVAIPNYNTKCTTPNFYGSRAEDQSLRPELPSVQSAGFHSLPGSRQANASPVRWPSSCVSDGSAVIQQSPFIGSSPSSRGQLRSVLYK